MCFRLNGSVRRKKDFSTRLSPFIISAYAPTNCILDETYDGFYQELFILLRKAKHSDMVVLPGDLSALVEKLCQPEKYVGGMHGVP